VTTTTSTRLTRAATRKRLDLLYVALEEVAALANDLDVDIRPTTLCLIDRVAAVATDGFGEIPPAVCAHLLAAMQAAISGDVPALVRYVDAALYAIEGPTRRPALSGQPRLPLVRAPAGGGAQSVQEVTERLLERLRHPKRVN
jgi:hypothetical protein